jgi:hypothetical protein
LYTLARFTDYLKPFSVTLKPFLDDIEATQKRVQDFADMATMEKVKGTDQREPTKHVALIVILSRAPFPRCSNMIETGNSSHLQKMLKILDELESDMTRLKTMEVNIDVR